MAKKKKARGFNMSEQVRKLVGAKKTITGKEVYERLVKRFPKRTINEGSCLVAFSTARNQLGLSKKVKKKGKKQVVKKKMPSTVTTVDLVALQAAAKFVAQVGDADTAIAAVKHLQSVQIL
jgi:hypothetical protein